MTTDKELIEVAKKYVEQTYPMYETKFLLDPIFIAGAEWQKTRWNEGVNVPDSENEKGQDRDILILIKKTKETIVGWRGTIFYFDKKGRHFSRKEVMWQEIYLPE